MISDNRLSGNTVEINKLQRKKVFDTLSTLRHHISSYPEKYCRVGEKNFRFVKMKFSIFKKQFLFTRKCISLKNTAVHN